MSDGTLSPEVIELLRDRVRSFESLEILMKLHADSREWSARELSEALSMDRDLAVSALDELHASGLLAARGAGRDRRWCYRPAGERLDEAARALAEAYRSSRLEIMHRMSDNALDRIRSSAVMTFADAFKITKRRSDG